MPTAMLPLLLVPLGALLTAPPGTVGAQQPAPAGGARTAPQAQHRVTGRVTNANNGAPMEGVTVLVQGTTIGAITDAQGRYRLAAPSPTSTLVFQRIGTTRQVVAIAGRAEVDVALEPTAVSLAGVVVTGYQTVETAKLTAAVATVSPAEIAATPTNSPIRALQGRVAGVSVVTNGDPTAESPQVRIRGLKTLGNNDPLYVIDGIPSKSAAAQRIRPEDIETIQVLKDAASASIYGSRASNGVIVLTTKSAARQTPQITYTSNVTTSQYAAKLDVLTTEERGRALWQAAVNDGSDPANLPIYRYEWGRNGDGTARLDRVIVPEFVGDPALRQRAANTDWFDAVSRTGVVQTHNLQAATSGERGGALLSLGYFDDNGIVRGTSFERLAGRVNSSYNFLDKRLTVGQNLSVTRGRGRPMPNGLGGNPLELGLIAQPILPIRSETGAWAGPSGAGFDDRDNPVMLIDINSWDRNTTVQGLGNLFARYDVTSRLQANARVGIDWQNGTNRDIQRRYRTGFIGRDVNSLADNGFSDADLTFNGTLNYARSLGRHNATLLGGVETVQSSFTRNRLYREGFAIETEDFFVENAGTGTQAVNGERGGYTLLSFFGKADYDFANRYLLSATLRRDGSSRFGRNNRFGLFPSVSGGWRLSEEGFFPKNRVLSNVKLRYGWGKTGNQDIDNNAPFSLYSPSYGDPTLDWRYWNPSNATAYDIGGTNGGTLPSGFLRTQTGNADLRWEETVESNAGVDFALFGEAITGSVDYFTRTTSDILLRPGFVATRGDGGARWANGATMRTRGLEVTARYERIAGPLTVSLGTNLSAFRDRITKLPPEVVGSYPGNAEQNILGRSITSRFGYEVQGIFQDAAEVAAAAAQPGKAVGRLRYRDLNGDNRIDALDQRYLMDNTPSFEYGVTPSVTWRSLQVSLFVQGVQGQDVYNGIKAQTDFTSNFTGANFGRRVLDAWSPTNRGSTIPALTLANTNDEFRQSTYFVENGSYLKLREVLVSYTVPRGVLPGPLGALREPRVFVRGGNLLTLKSSGTTLPDPEVPFGGYAVPRTFSFGLDTSF